MNLDQLIEKAKYISEQLDALSEQSDELVQMSVSVAKQTIATPAGEMSPLMIGIEMLIR